MAKCFADMCRSRLYKQYYILVKPLVVLLPVSVMFYGIDHDNVII